MLQTTIEQLRTWAAEYDTPGFIPADPVSFPHRFTAKQDIEISGFLTAWIAYGNRKQILKKAGELHTEMDGSPLAYIIGRRYAAHEGDTRPFYRFFKHSDLHDISRRLHDIYTTYPDLEAAVTATGGDPISALQTLFAGIAGIPRTPQSASKRLAMFVRWMVRRDGIVDFGLWRSIDPCTLLIPLDTHVFDMARRLGMTRRSTADRRAAEEITACLREIWPDDPCMGDFALFGYGVNEQKGRGSGITDAGTDICAPGI